MITDLSPESRKAIERCKSDVLRYIGHTGQRREDILASVEKQGDLTEGMSEAMKSAFPDGLPDAALFSPAGGDPMSKALESYLLIPFPDGLPSGDPCRRAAAEICEVAGKFVDQCGFGAENEAASWQKPEDFEESFRDSVLHNAHGMSAENAMRYVLSLIYTSRITRGRSLDGLLRGEVDVKSGDDLQKELDEVIAGLDGLTEEEIWKKVDGFIEILEPEVLSSVILHASNEALVDAAWEASSGKLMAELQAAAGGRAEQYAVEACALYTAVAQGLVPEIPRTAPPSAVALYFISNVSAAQVRADLKAGNITAGLAEQRLRKISQVVACLLAGLFLLATVVGGGVLICFLAKVLVDLSAPYLLTVACLAPLICCWTLYGALAPELVEDLGDFLDRLFGRLELKAQEAAAHLRLQKRKSRGAPQIACS